MAVLKTSEAPSWRDWITNFDKTFNAFQANFRGLKSVGGYVEKKHPELLPEYDKLLKEGVDNSIKLQQLKSIKDKVTGWLGSIGGFFGLGENEQELGLIPLIPVAIGITSASVALIAIGSWVKDTFVFSRRLNELQRLEAKGLTPQQAANVIDKTFGPAGGSLFGIDFKWVAIGLALIILGPPVIKMIQKRNG